MLSTEICITSYLTIKNKCKKWKYFLVLFHFDFLINTEVCIFYLIIPVNYTILIPRIKTTLLFKIKNKGERAIPTINP